MQATETNTGTSRNSPFATQSAATFAVICLAASAPVALFLSLIAEAATIGPAMHTVEEWLEKAVGVRLSGSCLHQACVAAATTVTLQSVFMVQTSKKLL